MLYGVKPLRALMKDSELLEAIASQDSKAFRQLVDRHQNQVMGLAYKFTRNSQDAEDIAQEVFLNIWKKAKKYRGESQVSTWIYRITVNTSLNYLRKHKRDKDAVSDEHLDGVADSAASQPDKTFEAEANKKMFYEALERLPEKLRVPFVLNKIEGLSYKQVADTLKISLANVESRIFRAKKNLQNILAELLK